MSIQFNRLSLAEQITEEVRKHILSGKFVPGQAITEKDLLEMFNVSRTPLREALQRLRSEGLIDISSSRRMSIANPCREDTRDRLVVLRALESCAARLATNNVGDKDIVELRKLQDKMVKASDKGEGLKYFEYNLELHKIIVELSANDFLIETHKEYNNALYRHRFLSSSHNVDNRSTAVSEHSEIIDALEHKDAEMLEKLMYQHLTKTLSNIETYWESHPRP